MLFIKMKLGLKMSETKKQENGLNLMKLVSTKPVKNVLFIFLEPMTLEGKPHQTSLWIMFILSGGL